MRRPLPACGLALALLVAAAPAANADHVPTNIGTKAGIPVDRPLNQKGGWRFLANLPNGPVHVPWSGADWETFTRDGKRTPASRLSDSQAPWSRGGGGHAEEQDTGQAPPGDERFPGKPFGTCDRRQAFTQSRGEK